MAGFMITVALENIESRKMTVILFCWKFLIWRASSIPGTRAIVLRQCIVFSSQNSALYSTRLLNQIMRFLGGIKKILSWLN